VNYQNQYDEIILKAKSENRKKNEGVYYEAHHILPECLGGEGKSSQWRWHPNIVLLTAKEHFECHRILSKIYPDNPKIRYSFWLMLNKASSKGQKRDYEISAEEYEEEKIIISELCKKRMTGRKDSEETRKKKMGNKNGSFNRNIAGFCKDRKPVNAISKITGEVIFFESCSSAGRSLNVDVSSIAKCANKKKKGTKYYYFEFA
jgi:hypothetical protein